MLILIMRENPAMLNLLVKLKIKTIGDIGARETSSIIRNRNKRKKENKKNHLIKKNDLHFLKLTERKPI